ncbi:YIP1 family protein [Candidatus Izemoplasma sp. B36]|uniref:YIP1 family protein n=1 Tax=Candidatus Izemoplasma sp. B36 TaxID=3242468 RepID=UPI00355648C4
MKKILLLFLLFTLNLIYFSTNIVYANRLYDNDYPYDTYTVDYKGELTYTQTAYTPVGVLNRDISLNNPEDIYIKDQLVYIADTGNKRVVVLDYSGNEVSVIGLGTLDKPTGVFVSDEDYIYIADKGNQLVYKYDTSGNLIDTFDRPTEPLFGKDSPYTPIKVVVGSGENIYVIGDGSTSGVIQLNYDGSFLGFFGVNLSDKSFVERVAEIFVKPGEYASNTPPSPTNITINNKSLVYTSTPNTETALKKLDVQGNNILTTVNYNIENNVVDLSVNDLGYLYAIYDDGLVVEYDPNGNLLFAYDIVSSSSNILGLIQNPSGIQVDEYNNLFILDMGRSEVVTYQPTSFTNLVHEAIDNYNEGNYDISTNLFKAVLEQNDNFALAHSALGKSYYQSNELDEALEEYYKANDLEGYSNTYWKIRDNWLKSNLSLIITVIIVLIVVSSIVKQLNKKTLIFSGLNEYKKKVSENKTFRRYTLMFKMLKHPIDSYYEIKREKRANYISALIILFVLFIEYLCYLRFAGYIFNNNVENIRLGMESLKFFSVILLFIFANYLISTLHDGEGWFKDVFISVIYALSPVVIFLPFYIILTNVLTLNETIILDIFSSFIFIYTSVLLFIGIREIHNYEIKETFKNILMTLFTILIIVIIVFIVYVFGSQLLDFIISWVKEVFYRV